MCVFHFCFSAAWVSFIDQARRRKLIKNTCAFGKSVSGFFDAVCAPGAKDEQHYRQRNEEYPKLCSVCSGISKRRKRGKTN